MPLPKRYEVLPSLPAYGPMYVSITRDDIPFYSEGFVVRFYKSDGEEWVANFRPGWTDCKEVVELKKTSNILVIAYGACYLINPDDTKPVAIFGFNYSNIFEANKDRFVLQGQIDITIVEPDGTYWNTERISWDGLVELKVQNNTISGLSYNPTAYSNEWSEFSYNVDTKILTGGSFNNFRKKKPWWKIW